MTGKTGRFNLAIAANLIPSFAEMTPKGKQVETWVFHGFFRMWRVRSAECSRQPFWIAVNRCWACVLLGLGNVQTIMPFVFREHTITRAPMPKP